MVHRMRVADPRDPDTPIDIEYRLDREPDDESCGYRGHTSIEVDGIDDLCPAHRADVIDQIHARHAS